jgi:hypothetical protein
MYAAAFSPWVTTRRMFMSSISAIAGIMMVGTKNTCVMPWACTASAKYRLPVIRAIVAFSK